MTQPRIILASTFQPLNKLTWEDVCDFVKTGYALRNAPSQATAVDNVTKGFTGDAMAIPGGFAYIVGALERDGKIKPNLPSPGFPNKWIVGWMLAIVTATSPEALAGARSALIQGLNRYKDEEKAVIVDACQKALNVATEQASGRPDSSYVFLKAPNAQAADADKQKDPDYTFGKFGRRNWVPSEAFKVVLVADRDAGGATPSQARAGIIAVSRLILAA